MHCDQCSYDLRGLPSGYCPECGKRFNPDSSFSYRTCPFDPSRVTARQTRHAVLHAALCAVGLAALALFAYLCLVAAAGMSRE